MTGYLGGAISVEDKSVVVATTCTLTRNSALQSGGAVFTKGTAQFRTQHSLYEARLGSILCMIHGVMVQ